MMNTTKDTTYICTFLFLNVLYSTIQQQFLIHFILD